MMKLQVFTAVCLLVAVACVVKMSPADLYTGGTLSLEWAIDSSDEIFLADLTVENPPEGPYNLVPRKALKGNIPVKAMADAISEDGRPNVERPRVRWIIGRGDAVNVAFRTGSDRLSGSSGEARHGDEWLLFVRQEPDEPLYLVRAINLMRPRETSATSAITADGKPLKTKQEVMDAVTARLALGRRLPPECRREMIDRWDKPDGGIASWSTGREGDWFLRPSDVAMMRGGFTIGVGCDYWDDPEAGDVDEDLLLTHLVVSADAAHFELLAERVRKMDHPADTDIFALLNYPGPQTEELLQSKIHSHSARRAWLFLRYGENLTDPLNQQLVGPWRLLGRRERVELDLRADQTCEVDVIETTGARRQRLEGEGYWAVKDGKLWLSRSRIQVNDKWREARREFFEPKKILATTGDAVTLEDGPPMVRP